jgi:Zn-dependent peptidase ImmA (M78 family)
MIRSPRDKAEKLNVNIYEKRLPSGIEGFYVSDSLDKFIVVDSTLTEIKKNCIITHELIHHQRTPGHQAVAHFSVTEAIPVRKAERKVEKETALALISDKELEKALAKAGDRTEWEIAEELGVTVDVLRLRIELYKQKCKIF